MLPPGGLPSGGELIVSATLRDVWNEQKAFSRDEHSRIAKRLAELDSQREKLIQAFVYDSKIDKATYDIERGRIESESAALRAELEALDEGVDDVDSVLTAAESLLTKLATVWNRAEPEGKRRLQAVLFPQGIPFEGGTFGTAPTSLLFKYFEPVSADVEGVARPGRIELPTPRLGGGCSIP